MNKKKIIAIGATATSLLLIAGIGVAAWVVTSKNGSVNTDPGNIGGVVTPPATEEANWGTMTINNASNFKVAFDQNRIVFTTVTEDTNNEGHYIIPENHDHITATWTADSTSKVTPHPINEVEYYAYIYISNTDISYQDYDGNSATARLTDYIDFVTSGSGDAWTAVSGEASQVTEATVITDQSDKAITGFTGYKYKLAAGTAPNMGVTVPSGFWGSSTTLDLTINLDNLLMYKNNNKLPLDGTDPDAEKLLYNFAMLFYERTEPAVKVVIEAKSKAA